VNLKSGTIAELEGPYGNFDYHPHKNAKQIWIAGGIGITPFIGMAENIERSNVNLAGIDLYYCVKNKEDAIYLEWFNEVALKVKGFRVISICSNEQGRLNVKQIAEISNGLKDKVFLMCGPEHMVAEIEKQLIKNNVSNKNIHREFFGFK
jgi:predicted ferric reductase